MALLVTNHSVQSAAKIPLNRLIGWNDNIISYENLLIHNLYSDRPEPVGRARNSLLLLFSNSLPFTLHHQWCRCSHHFTLWHKLATHLWSFSFIPTCQASPSHSPGAYSAALWIQLITSATRGVGGQELWHRWCGLLLRLTGLALSGRVPKAGPVSQSTG